jgi:catechol 2,3-dioxygenase-like lactoylglutathione lyase family enzyme
MTLHGFTHLALRVGDLRKAEAFYCELFALEVAFREVETDGGWWTLPALATWDDVQSAGAEIGLVMLYRNGLRLALERAQPVARRGSLSHVGLHADASELPSIRRRATASACKIVAEHENALILDDPFGVRWELNTFPYDSPVSLSTGARLGQWLPMKVDVSQRESEARTQLHSPDQPRLGTEADQGKR